MNGESPINPSKIVCLCCGVDELDEYIQLDLEKHTGVLLREGDQYRLIPMIKPHSEGYVFCSGGCAGKYLSEQRTALLIE